MKKRAVIAISYLPFLALPFLAACGPSGGHAAATEGKAKVAASAADQQLVHDGYTATHVPGFGKFDIGVSDKTYRYEAVYTVPAKDAKLAQLAVERAQGKLGGRGTKLEATSDLIIAQATTLSDLKAAAKAVVASAK